MRALAVIQDVPTSVKAVAFTFDDGPSPEYTPQILDIFTEAGGKATFYMIGEEIDAYPDVAKLVHDHGHEIGNHTYTHPNLTELTEAEAVSQLMRTDRLIYAVTGAKVRTFRPPYLACNDMVLSISREVGYPVIGACNGDARDWEAPGVRHILEASRSAIRNGSILLFHDGYGNRSQTVEAVRVLANELIANGYKLVTVSELLRMGRSQEEE